MKRKCTSLPKDDKSDKRIKTENNENYYTIHNLIPDRPNAIKKNIYLHNFENLSKLDKLIMFEDTISQIHGWYILDEFEFYNKDYKYSCYWGQIESLRII